MKSDTLIATDEYSAARANHPRVSLASMEAKIAYEGYFLGSDALFPDHVRQVHAWEATKNLTICILVMMNGFTVIGKSAPASPENFDPEKGRRFAYEDAIKQLWPLEGYLLREELNRAGSAVVQPHDGMAQFVGTKIVNAKPMTRGDYHALRGWATSINEDPSEAGYLVEYTDAQRPNIEGFPGYVSWSPADVFEKAYR